MNSANNQVQVENADKHDDIEFTALTSEQLQLIAGGECVVNQV